ncbi:MAG: glycosyltransferase family 4 protein [Acidimicrobiaceae bacterium]|nr:glycosyltransferase family 4 protein [Acidimicrobiaceae bacterium]
MAAIRVAFDTGPLHGARTGIGHAVAELQAALTAHPGVDLQPYLLSFRARPQPPTVRLPIPAAVAHRLWRRVPWPRLDRHLGDAQVVHGTNYVVPPTRRPAVVSVYDCWFLRHSELASPAVVRAGEVLRAAVRRGAHVHASSQTTAAAVAELLPGAPVTTVHLGPLPVPAPLPRSPLAELIEHRFVLAVGTVERRKNLPTLVRAFAVPAAADPHLRLVLAGAPGDATDAVRVAIDGLPPAVGRRVLVTGRIDEPTRGWLLRNAAVLAYPSLDEGFGFPLLDAMQAGVPVVASTAGSIPEVAGDAALLCAADDDQRLGALLAEAIADPGLAARLVAAGHEQVRRFSWARCAAEMANLYEVVAGLTGPGPVRPAT